MWWLPPHSVLTHRGLGWSETYPEAHPVRLIIPGANIRWYCSSGSSEHTNAGIAVMDLIEFASGLIMMF